MISRFIPLAFLLVLAGCAHVPAPASAPAASQPAIKADDEYPYANGIITKLQRPFLTIALVQGGSREFQTDKWTTIFPMSPDKPVPWSYLQLGMRVGVTFNPDEPRRALDIVVKAFPIIDPSM
jgi:hypothetical protein